MKKIAAIVLGLGLIGFLSIGLNSSDKAVAYGDYPAPSMLVNSDYDGAHGDTI
ncbi:Phr family secreted Rap phosphatase inhibitor [Bacillus dicomae]|uniref:Phr family secreted Rap phosphatase inhibitor n=1 Tax=Bacillus dicomae TaxID=3088378 RepID=A0AC61SZZ4_9BACI|nr:Phr family secreted Rap phosphatase inhibitor [Bacillus dicomae]TPV39628.1 Phr family secreted Rap phosphatase inhibitor [Bacillus dicomae]